MKESDVTAFRLKLRHELEAADDYLKAEGHGFFASGPCEDCIAKAMPHLSELVIACAAFLHELRKEQRR